MPLETLFVSVYLAKSISGGTQLIKYSIATPQHQHLASSTTSCRYRLSAVRCQGTTTLNFTDLDVATGNQQALLVHSIRPSNAWYFTSFVIDANQLHLRSYSKKQFFTPCICYADYFNIPVLDVTEHYGYSASSVSIFLSHSISLFDDHDISSTAEWFLWVNLS